MATKPLIKESLFCLNNCGLNPTNKSLSSKIRLIIAITFLIHFVIELTLEFALKWKGWESLDDLAIYFAFFLVLIKMIVVILNGDKINKILRLLLQFDSCKNYGLEMQIKIENIFIFIKQLMIIYGVAPIICAIAFSSKPLFGVARSLPFHTYHPLDYHHFYYYQAMYAIQETDFFFAFMTMYGFDILFLSFITHIVCEYKLLKFRFLNTHIEDFSDLKPLLVHHNLILECVKNLDEIYSVLFLVQFFFSLVGLCSGLLIIIVTGLTENLNRLFLNTGFVCAYLGQLLVYCVAGAYLKSESESVSDAVYGSNWWVKTQSELRRAYILIIQRAQKAEELTAGGMLPLNLTTFTKILKTSMSFFMLAQALYTRSKT